MQRFIDIVSEGEKQVMDKSEDDLSETREFKPNVFDIYDATTGQQIESFENKSQLGQNNNSTALPENTTTSTA